MHVIPRCKTLDRKTSFTSCLVYMFFMDHQSLERPLHKFIPHDFTLRLNDLRVHFIFYYHLQWPLFAFGALITLLPLELLALLSPCQDLVVVMIILLVVMQWLEQL